MNQQKFEKSVPRSVPGLKVPVLRVKNRHSGEKGADQLLTRKEGFTLVHVLFPRKLQQQALA